MNFYSEKDLIEIEILQKLKEVIDPELAINIVDMGLIYKVNYVAEKKVIHIDMTLSTKACPMGDNIRMQIEDCMNRHYPSFKLNLKLVWEPQWTRDFISAEGKKQLGAK
jgi:metal-sulfur cluster biosynthetic enzyme